MTTNAAGLGGLVYELELKFTGMTDYGISMEDIASGQAAPPPAYRARSHMPLDAAGDHHALSVRGI